MEYKQCACGQKICLVYKWNGVAGVPVFVNITDNNCKEFVNHCPGCGELLYENDLQSVGIDA